MGSYSLRASHETAARPLLLILIVVAGGLVAGCSASGHPRFAKFSPDGRHLIYEDLRYSRVYIYEPHTERRSMLVGTVACLDKDVRRFILVPYRMGRYYTGPFPIPCSLVTVGVGGPTVERLPPLPANMETTTIFMSFAPEQNAVLARALRSTYPPPDAKSGQFFILSLGESTWIRADDRWLSFPDHEYWMSDQPGGVRQGRYFYAPAEGLDPGLDSNRSNREYEEILHGPDKECSVRIWDYDDAWRRTTITVTTTGRKQIILDKNDSVLDVLDVLLKVVLYPFGPFMPKI